MSGADTQPGELIVIKNEETRDKLHQVYMEGRIPTHDLEMMRIK